MVEKLDSPWGLVSSDIQEPPDTASIYKLEIQLENSERLFLSFDPLELLIMNPDTSERMMIKFHPRTITRGKKSPFFLQGKIQGYNEEFDIRLRLKRGDSTDYGTVEVSGQLD